jgi:tetratricopeptide (TPR) repeat protein
VVPSHAEPWLVSALLDGFGRLAEAEQRGILEMRADGLAFRHELARQALERTLPAGRRIELNRAVRGALLARDDVDLSRVVHHAVAAGDVDTILAHGPAAAREAAQAGSHRQALAHYEHVVAHLDGLPDHAKARVLVDYAWQLYAAQRWSEAVDAAGRAVSLWTRIGDQIALGDALVAVSRSAFMADRPTGDRDGGAGGPGARGDQGRRSARLRTDVLRRAPRPDGPAGGATRPAVLRP